MSSSSKQRTTWTMASTSRMWVRNLLPRPSPCAGALDQAGDVHELDRGGDDHLASSAIALQLGEPRIGHGDDADVGIDGAEGIIGRFGLAGAGDGVEQRGLADIRQSDDSGSQHDDDEAPGANDNFSGYLTAPATHILPRHGGTSMSRLVLALALSCLAGCGSTPSTPTQPSSTAGSQRDVGNGKRLPGPHHRDRADVTRSTA